MEGSNIEGDSWNDPLASIRAPQQPPGELVRQGAEARIYSVPGGILSSLPSIPCIVKERFVKTYRHPTLDAALSLRRMRAEARQLVKCHQIGLPVPALLLVDMAHRQLWMQDLCSPHGTSLADWFHALLSTPASIIESLRKKDYLDDMARNLGQLLAKMHANSIIHGDLTTANVIVQMDDIAKQFFEYRLWLIDFGLSSVITRSAASFHDEEVAVDLYVFERALISSLATKSNDTPSDGDTFDFKPDVFFESVLSAYETAYAIEVVNRPFETARSTSVRKQQLEKRPRQQSNMWLPTEEDGILEVRGVLKSLNEVRARGRKRLMIG